MVSLVATSVVRGSHQGESHGGVYIVDLAKDRVYQPIDWNTMDIDWQGRGWDRGLRGIAFDDNRVFRRGQRRTVRVQPEFRACRLLPESLPEALSRDLCA